MTMLLAVRLSPIRPLGTPSPSAVLVPAPVTAPESTVSSPAASHSRPSSYGFANGEPLMLSMLSSFRGQRGGGGYAGVFGIAGLKLEAEGTRTGVGRVTWRARDAAVCLMGDAARMRGAEGMRATLWGYDYFVSERIHVSDSTPQNRKVGEKRTYGTWGFGGLHAGGDVPSREGWRLLLR